MPRWSLHWQQSCALGVALIVLAPAAAGAFPVVKADGTGLEYRDRPFRVYGFNYDFDDVHPNIDYIDTTTPANLARVRADFAEAVALGANTMRIYLELHDFVAGPDQVRPGALRALRRLLREAERVGLLLDVTGNLAWHKKRSPRWYDELGDRERWKVQARFWKAVAGVGARSPAIFAYELASEPSIGDADEWYTGILTHHYVQYVVRELRGRDPVALARDWTRTLRDAVRSRDRRHLITVGLLPVRGWAFDPVHIADLLDLVTVHEYPEPGELEASLGIVRHFSEHGKPLLLGETFAFSRPVYEDFMVRARHRIDGSLSFYDGRAVEEVEMETVVDSMYRQNLISYLGLRTSLRASPPIPSR